MVLQAIEARVSEARPLAAEPQVAVLVDRGAREHGGVALRHRKHDLDAGRRIGARARSCRSRCRWCGPVAEPAKPAGVAKAASRFCAAQSRCRCPWPSERVQGEVQLIDLAADRRHQQAEPDLPGKNGPSRRHPKGRGVLVEVSHLGSQLVGAERGSIEQSPMSGSKPPVDERRTISRSSRAATSS